MMDLRTVKFLSLLLAVSFHSVTPLLVSPELLNPAIGRTAAINNNNNNNQQQLHFVATRRKNPPSTPSHGRIAVVRFGISNTNESDDKRESNAGNGNNNDEQEVVFVEVERDEDLPEGLMEEIESTRPSEWMVMQEVCTMHAHIYTCRSYCSWTHREKC